MYELLNKNEEFLLNEGIKEKLINHFRNYLEILNRSKAETLEYQNKYKKFWGMNVARNLHVNKEFNKVYFSYLKNSKKASLCDLLNQIKKTNAGFQFSFTTKAIHIIDPSQPIYDAKIKDFFFLPEFSVKKKWEEKIEIVMKNYTFLQQEYSVIQKKGKLSLTIKRINKLIKDAGIQPNKISTVKKIDSIIWSWVSYLKKGALVDKKVTW